MTERTLILLKPDAVQRTISGEIISRFEKAGLKIIGMKMVWCDKAHALKHYTEDIGIRRGEKVRANLLESITSGPVIAMCIEGVEAIEVVRKMVGSTEPKGAAPGTIRGDYAHMSYTHADKVSRALPNLIHASSSREDSINEVALWFKPEELHSYKTVQDIFMI